jgi:hypothetical protein
VTLRSDAGLGDGHAHDRCQGDAAGRQVQLVEVDSLPVDGAGLGIEGRRDVEMGVVGAKICIAGLSVVNEQLALVAVEEAVRIHPRLNAPTTSSSIGPRFDDEPGRFEQR